MSKLESVWMNTHPNDLLGLIILYKESKIYRWYKKLAAVDSELQKDDLAAHLEEYLTRLNHIEAKVCQTSVPFSFSNKG